MPESVVSSPMTKSKMRVFGDFFILLFFVLKLAAIQAHQPEDFPLAYQFYTPQAGKVRPR